MWKIVKSEIYYQNDMIRFSFIFAGLFIIFYFFASIADTGDIYSADRILILILPVLFSTYILKHIQGVVLDIREKRGRQLLMLPIRLKDCGYARVIEPLLLFLTWVVMSGFTFLCLSFLIKGIEQLSISQSTRYDAELDSYYAIRDQVRIYSNYFFSILLITIMLKMAKDRFGAYLLAALACIFAIIVFTPGLLIYYEDKLLIAVDWIFSTAGSLILSVIFALVIWYSFLSRIYNDTINFNLQNIFFMVRDEVSYMGSRLRLRYQLLIGFVIAFFFYLIFMSEDQYYERQFSEVIFFSAFATMIIVYIVNNFGLLINEIIEKRVKLTAPLPVKRSSVAFTRLLNPYTIYAASTVIFVILYNVSSLHLSHHYQPTWDDPTFYENIAITSALFLIFTFLLRLVSEIPGRVLLGIIAFYFAVYSILLMNGGYDHEYYYDPISVSFYVYSVNFLIEFSATFTGSVFLSALMAILLYYSFMQRKSYLK